MKQLFSDEFRKIFVRSFLILAIYFAVAPIMRYACFDGCVGAEASLLIPVWPNPDERFSVAYFSLIVGTIFLYNFVISFYYFVIILPILLVVEYGMCYIRTARMRMIGYSLIALFLFFGTFWLNYYVVGSIFQYFLISDIDFLWPSFFGK